MTIGTNAGAFPYSGRLGIGEHKLDRKSKAVGGCSVSKRITNEKIGWLFCGHIHPLERTAQFRQFKINLIFNKFWASIPIEFMNIITHYWALRRGRIVYGIILQTCLQSRKKSKLLVSFILSEAIKREENWHHQMIETRWNYYAAGIILFVWLI